MDPGQGVAGARAARDESDVTSDEWARVRDLFEAALKQRPSQRAAFLDEACADNPAVRAEVTSLLDAHDSAADFIEAPAYEVAADLLADDPPESLAGRTLGPYIIRHEIGRGGMGVVYLADDTRLSRRVALKAIAPGAGSDANAAGAHAAGSPRRRRLVPSRDRDRLRARRDRRPVVSGLRVRAGAHAARTPQGRTASPACRSSTSRRSSRGRWPPLMRTASSIAI